MNLSRNEANVAVDDYLRPRQPAVKFERPHGDDTWSYRTLSMERTVARAYLAGMDLTQTDAIERLAIAMCHFACDPDLESYHPDYQGIEDVWNEETIYPDPNYELMRFSPEGQCGVTNFAFGMLLASTDIVRRENIRYARGELYAADGTLLDPDHTWLHVIGDNDDEWRIDLTSHQSAERNSDPNGFMRIVVQPVRPGQDVEPHPLINQPPLSRDEYFNYSFPAKNATALVYKEKESTPIEEYDISTSGENANFGKRLARFIDRSGMNGLGESIIGFQNSKYSIALGRYGLWYPDTYDFAAEASELEGVTNEPTGK